MFADILLVFLSLIHAVKGLAAHPMTVVLRLSLADLFADKLALA